MDKIYAVKSSSYSISRYSVSEPSHLIFNGPSQDHILVFSEINDAILFMDGIASKSLNFIREVKSMNDLKEFTDIDIDTLDVHLGISDIENNNTRKIFVTTNGFVVMDIVTYLLAPKNINVKKLFKERKYVWRRFIL